MTDDIWAYTVTGVEPGEDGLVRDRPTLRRTRLTTDEYEEIAYTANNSITTRVDALGNKRITHRYMSSGLLNEKPFRIELQRTGETEPTVIWRGIYDAQTGDLLRSFDAHDEETTYAYVRHTGSSLHRPPEEVVVTRPLGRTTTIKRDSDDNVSEIEGPDGVIRRFQWDARRRITAIKDAANEVLAAFQYGDKDQVLRVTDALGNQSFFEYETVHLGSPLLTKSISPLGLETEFTYDSKGRSDSLTAPSGAQWTFEYLGSSSAIEKIENPDSTEIEFEFDSRLNPIKTTDEMGRETESVFDDLDLPATVTDALGNVTTFARNAYGAGTQIEDARENTYAMDWATRGARSELAWPDDLKQVAEYDLEGRLTQLKPRGPDATIDYTYNAAGESTGWTWTNGLESGSATLTRDSAGRIASASTTTMALTVSQEFTYDTESRLSELEQTIGNVTRTATATYQRDGQLSTLTYPAGFTITYEYNADNQITAIKKGTTTLASYGYDSAGRLSTRTLANGLTTHYTYNSMSRLTQLTVTGPGGTLWAQRYGFNLSGQRIHTLTGTSGTIGDAYNLDATGQLTGVTYEATGADGGYASATNPSSTATWGYDEVGNRTTQVDGAGTTTYTANDINQYTAIAGAQSQGPLTYSTRGDLIENGDWTYTFDADGNLIRAHNTQNNTLAKYWRDAAGHRAVKDIDGQKIFYFNFGFWPLEAYDLTAETTRSTIYAPGLDNPLCEINDDGSIRFFYHQDWLGNVALLTDDAGAKLQAYSYDVWGKPSGFDATGNPIAASAYESRFLFTAREYDSETDLYHYRARAYSPGMGRFAQFDPIDFSGGDFNLVRYVANNPINQIDPTGEFAWIAAGAAIGAVVNVGITFAANGGNVTGQQLAAAAASGAISGALGAVAGPLGGTIARGLLGTASNGLAASAASAALSAGGGALGQSAANAIDPCNASNPLNAALYGGIGGGLAKGLFPTKNLNTWAQAQAFGPKTVGGLFGSSNASMNNGAFATSSGVGGAANFPGINPF